MHVYPLNQLNGVQMEIIDNIIGLSPIKDLKSASNFLERVKRIPKVVEDLMKDIKWRTQKGLIPPKHYLSLCITQMEALLTTDVKENVLYKTFHVLASKKLEKSQLNEMCKTLETTLEKNVYSCYQSLILQVKEMLNVAPEEVGLWRVPNGERIYQILIEKETSTSMTAKQIFETGLKCVENTKNKIMQLLVKEGFPPNFSDAIFLLKNDEKFLFEDSQEGRQDILKSYQNLLSVYKQKCENFFGVVISADLQIVRVPKYKESNAIGAYYNPASLDRKKPGTFCVNLKNVSLHPTYGIKTLFFHEGKPIPILFLFFIYLL